MTDLTVRPKRNKRQRLIAATRDLLHRQGVEKTTLADIAQAADVPVGNVYYYFKTKDELVEAAIRGQLDDLRAMLDSLERLRTPQARLKAFINELCRRADLVARYGCPLGSLCSELDKRDDAVERVSAQLLEIPIAWLREQFGEMGRRDAEGLALALMASYQGIALLTNTFHDPKLMTSECRRLERWIDSLD
jgi:TetR/AcrR family transcriptional regulator, transcriptional repressor for nem operon